ncbi:two pore calcium channel protein 1-like [Ischnura elegans]|uniref:two pore calcium channel protein 1-like n=1 Tax=Ischnura elegans TaxID=197161 RepID=UPI001ED89920|nr:two pore calcium channel protein 1-like [Ischnura elegans]
MATSGRQNQGADGYSRFTNENVQRLPNEEGRVPSTLDGLESNGVEMLTPHELRASSDASEWRMIYHEAAIYLEEGNNNEKFDSHPKDRHSLPAYLIVHSPWYYGLDLSASLVLLALGFVEPPAIPLFQLPVGVHGSIELIALTIVGVELLMKIRWLGWRVLLNHKRTLIKGTTLAIMVVEAIVVLIRQSSHFRVTRSLRPIFLIDNFHLGGVRRFIRQMLQSMPPVCDMLGLVLFCLMLYALLGFYLFGSGADPYFRTLLDSFVSLFVLLTTANYPDVMMPSYAKSKWFCLFFISYICLMVFFLMNLLLAVVYDTFTSIERNKFKKLWLHKRLACGHAFRLLTSKHPSHNRLLPFMHFRGLMHFYAPKKSMKDILLTYKALLSEGSDYNYLTLKEFCHLYECLQLTWEQAPREDGEENFHFHPNDRPLFRRFSAFLCGAAKKVVGWQYFETIVYILVAGNGIAMLTRIALSSGDLQLSALEVCASWDTLFFIGMFSVEAIIRVMALGVSKYFASGWNVWDFSVTLGCLLGLMARAVDPSLTAVVVLRPLRMLRLFRLKKRYRDVFGTLLLLLPHMGSAALVLVILYYSFAVVGMELFSGYKMKNCCKNSTVADYYRTDDGSGIGVNASTGVGPALGYYHLNNFGDLTSSAVTLFELTVVNNWFVIMEGYVAASESQWSRIYFMIFYLATMIVLTIIVASILEAFRFRIEYKRETSKTDEEKMLRQTVMLDWDEVQQWMCNFTASQLQQALHVEFPIEGKVTFVGLRPRTREVLQARMYKAEMEKWEHEELEGQSEGHDPLGDEYQSGHDDSPPLYVSS